ncbi:hypothetical protein AHAS_Ahas11G0143200 [Arachis hypogaea]
MASKNPAEKKYNQTKDLRCFTRLLHEKLKNMSEVKKAIVWKLGFDGDLFPKKVNFKELSEENKELYRRFHRKILKNLADEMMDIGVDTDQDRLIFKKIFILYIQMTFLLPTTINKDRELLVQRIKAEHDGHMGIVKREDLKKKLKKMKEKEKKEKKEKDKKKKESSSESDIAISLSMSLNKTQRK